MQERPVLCLVVDRTSSRHPLPQAVQAAFRGGADWLQLRERALEGREWLAWAEELSAAAHRGAPAETPPRVLVNRRVDIALAIGADGVHLGFDALAAADARALLGPAAWIGASCHGADEVRQAARAGLQYAHLAPIHDPLSKAAERPALGLRAVREAAQSAIAVIAQGGITPDNAAAVIGAGATGVAVTGTVLLADDPERASRALRGALDGRD